MEQKDKLGDMFNYIDVSFRLQCFSQDTRLVCLFDEQNGTLSSKHADIIKALPISRFCGSRDLEENGWLQYIC